MSSAPERPAYLAQAEALYADRVKGEEMAAVTPQMVKQLRDRTDQPMGLCKQALD